MKRVLVVDDDATLRMALTRYLEKRGYVVQNVRSGTEALETFEQDPPDLVVSDVMMPGGVSGLDLAREIRRRALGCRNGNVTVNVDPLPTPALCATIWP